MKEITIAGNGITTKDETPTLGYVKASALPKGGVTIEAVYLGSFTGGKYGSTTHYLKLNKANVSVSNSEGINVAAKVGNKIGLSGTKILNLLLSQVTRGSNVNIEYSGMKEFQTKSGETAREAQFKVFADSSEPTVADQASAAVDILAS